MRLVHFRLKVSDNSPIDAVHISILCNISVWYEEDGVRTLHPVADTLW